MKISTYFFIFIYIGSIFLFALIYSLMPNSFYHTTVKYEKSILTGMKELEPDFLKEIKENLRTCPNSDSVILPNIRFSLKDLRISDLYINDYAAYFSMNIISIKTTNGEIMSLSNYHIGFNDYEKYEEGHSQPHTVFIYDDEAFPFWYGGRLQFLFNKNNLVIRPHSVVPNYTNKKTPNDKGFLLFSDALINKLCSYSKAQEGFPSFTSGDYSRMFYLSAITITTVGFGDILPITPLARVLVSIEAIWGIIIIGLFLNSLANRIRYKK